MKTAIKNLIAATFAVITLTTSAFAAEVKENQVTVLNDVKNISKIKVSGNVNLVLVQSNAESVKVYDNYYAKNALVQQQNGELFISSFDKERLTVVVYVNNLTELTATDNATVETLKQMNLISLDVKLQSKATANLNINAVTLNSTVAGNAVLNLEGKAADLNANIESIAKLNMDKFASETTNVVAKNRNVAKVVADDSISALLSK